ncbi:MAG: hypothetical protein ACI9XO_001614 [Paraglaciecola sp.]|jgi:hypothetical protein
MERFPYFSFFTVAELSSNEKKYHGLIDNSAPNFGEKKIFIPAPKPDTNPFAIFP